MEKNNVCQEHPVDAGNRQEQREVHPIFAPILGVIKGEQVRNATKGERK